MKELNREEKLEVASIIGSILVIGVTLYGLKELKEIEENIDRSVRSVTATQDYLISKIEQGNKDLEAGNKLLREIVRYEYKI